MENNENQNEPQEDKNGYKKWKIIAVIVGFVLLIAIFDSLNQSMNKGVPISNQKVDEVEVSEVNNEKKTSEDNHENDAWVCAQFKIESMLTNPSSADFEFGGAEYSTTYLGDNKYSIDSYVEAENSFGAKVKQKFSCSVVYDSIEDSCQARCNFK